MNTRKTTSDKHNDLYDENKKAILAVSCGTSNIEIIEKTIGAIEASIARALPDYEIRRAFTSRFAIDAFKKKYTAGIDSVEQAMEKLIKDGVRVLVIQPTHIICGYEYSRLVSIAEKYKDEFEAVSMGAPLLTTDNDYTALVNALADEAAEYGSSASALVFAGHGTDHTANSAYSTLQAAFSSKGMANCFVGTINAAPNAEDIIVSVKEVRYKRVILRPLMITAGVHALRDIAGNANSWRSAFEAEGFEVHCVLNGIGEIKAVQDIYAAHAGDAVKKLDPIIISNSYCR